MKNIIKDFFSDIRKTRWNKTKPSLKIFAITLIIVAIASAFVFLVSWGITSIFKALRG